VFNVILQANLAVTEAVLTEERMSFTNKTLMQLSSIGFLCFALVWYSSIALSTVITLEQVQCSYDPNTGQPNPFGSGAFITVTQRGSDTTFRYTGLASLVQFPNQTEGLKSRAVTLENTRTMIFYNTQMEVARAVMRQRKDYYHELIGYKDESGFSAYDDAMSCE